MLFLISLYILLLPFQWALSPVPGIDLASSRIFALVLIALWAASGLARRSLLLPRPAVFLPLLSFLAIVSASFFWAEDRSFALRKTIFLWNFLPLFIVFASSLRTPLDRALMIRVIASSGILAGSVGIIQSAAQVVFGVERVFAFWTGTLLPFFLGDALGGSVASYPSLLVNIGGATVLRASAFFPDPHMLSLFLGLTLPAAILYAFSQPSGQRTLPIIGSSIILIADLLTFSRGGYVGLAAGIITAGLVSMNGRVSVRTIRRTVAVALASIALSIALALTPVGTRFLSSFSSDDGSNSERLRLWQEAIHQIADRPLLGTGIGNYPLAVKPTADYREPIYAHSLYLDIAAETGLLGLATFLSFLGIAAATAYYSFTKKRSPSGIALLSALAVFSAHSVFELPLFSVQVLPLFLAIAALASSEGKEKTSL